MRKKEGNLRRKKQREKGGMFETTPKKVKEQIPESVSSERDGASLIFRTTQVGS